MYSWVLNCNAFIGLCALEGYALINLIKEGRGFVIMNMNDALKIAVALSISAVLMKIVMNVIYHFGVDFVGFFEDLWKKLKRTNRL